MFDDGKKKKTDFTMSSHIWFIETNVAVDGQYIRVTSLVSLGIFSFQSIYSEEPMKSSPWYSKKKKGDIEVPNSDFESSVSHL